MFIAAAAFKTAKSWKQFKCPFTDEWINKCDIIYPYNGILFDYESNKILIHTTTCMDLENIIPRERIQTQNVTLYDCIYIKYLEYDIL